jgi:hypothetical protein
MLSGTGIAQQVDIVERVTEEQLREFVMERVSKGLRSLFALVITSGFLLVPNSSQAQLGDILKQLLPEPELIITCHAVLHIGTWGSIGNHGADYSEIHHATTTLSECEGVDDAQDVNAARECCKDWVRGSGLMQMRDFIQAGLWIPVPIQVWAVITEVKTELNPLFRQSSTGGCDEDAFVSVDGTSTTTCTLEEDQFCSAGGEVCYSSSAIPAECVEIDADTVVCPGEPISSEPTSSEAEALCTMNGPCTTGDAEGSQLESLS